MTKQQRKAAAAGGLAGIANGLFGVGGGMIMTPLLLRWLKIDEKKAMVTSVAIILPLCCLSAVIYLFNRDIPGPALWPFLLGGLLGGLIAGLTYGRVRGLWLRRAFALLALYGGLRALLG